MSELKGREVLKIKALSGQHPYNADSKLAGNFYRRFAVGDKVFVANCDDKFCTDFDAGIVYSVTLATNENDQLSLSGHTTIAQEVNMAKTERLLEGIKLTPFVKSEVSFEELI